jgi:hypothetical protein
MDAQHAVRVADRRRQRHGDHRLLASAAGVPRADLVIDL